MRELSIEMQNSLIFLSITGLLFGVLLNPMSWIQSVGYILSTTILEPLHIAPTLADQLENAKYVKTNDEAVKAFDYLIKIGEPYLKYTGPEWINENVYVALVNNNGNIVDDYQIKISNGKPVCYGKTPKVGGSTNCGKPTVWVKVDEYAVLQLENVKTIGDAISKAENLFFGGHIDVYPKSVAFKYIDKIGSILSAMNNQ